MPTYLLSFLLPFSRFQKSSIENNPLLKPPGLGTICMNDTNDQLYPLEDMCQYSSEASYEDDYTVSKY